MSRHAVLVYSTDTLAAALLGALIELSGHLPHFAQEGESSRNALLRVRPRLALIDCDHEEACSELFIGPALMTGSRVLLFRSRRTHRDVGELVERLGLAVMELPREQGMLTRVLQQLPA